MAEENGRMRVTGYRHTQKNLLPTPEEAFGDYETKRVPISIISAITGIDFDQLSGWDVADSAFESAAEISTVHGRSDIGFG